MEHRHARLAIALTVIAMLAGATGARAADVSSTDRFRNAFLAGALTRTTPRYPPEARAAGVEGTVTVVAHVTPAGRVRGMEIEESIPMLDQAALDCVRQWTFRTPRYDGEPIGMRATIPIRFRLEGRPTGAAVPHAGHGPGGNWDVPMPGWYFDEAHAPDGQSIQLHHRSRDSLWIECLGRWQSEGTFADSAYRGTIAWLPSAADRQYRWRRNDADSLYRGAHGTLVAKLLPDGWLDASFEFGPKGPPPYSLRLKPSIGDQGSYSWDVPTYSPIRHPVWPPARDSTAGQEEHPVWPPTRSKPNAAILPAAPAHADSTGR